MKMTMGIGIMWIKSQFRPYAVWFVTQWSVGICKPDGVTIHLSIIY